MRKPKGSYWAHKEWAPSVKLLQQNFNRRVRISGEGEGEPWSSPLKHCNQKSLLP